MHVPFDISGDIESALGRASGALEAGTGPDFSPEIRPADPRHGDFQSNGVLGYAKARRLNPRQVAQKLVDALPSETPELYEVAIAGPGFINFRLRPSALLAWLQSYDSRAHLNEGATRYLKGHRNLVDFCSPNTAKQLHVGHLRGMVIGEAICRLLEFCGADVIRDNHVGDWGTQFGKLIWGYKNLLDETALAADPLEEFERLYKAADAASRDREAVLDAARAELVKLQAGDPENRAIWEKIVSISSKAFHRIYDRLDVRFDHEYGESFYNDRVADVFRELTETGLAVESQGALVVFHPEHPRFRTQPFIIRKSDGAANYASSDLAAMRFRATELKADTIVVLTDTRQNDHFEQLWLTTQKWFAATKRPLPRFEHITFGAVLGEDGKPIRTRAGDTIRLKALLDEAEERAFAIVTEKSPDLPEAERRSIAAAVGLGAVRYSDLAQNRSSDYVFSWDRILSMEGNTAPYLLYAIARIRSIFRKAEMDPSNPDFTKAATPPETEGEIALARKLVGFAATLRTTITQLRPHFLCTYLHELAGEFSTFYNADRVIVDDPAVRARRLLLCARTLLIMETGLGLLGLRTLERM